MGEVSRLDLNGQRYIQMRRLFGGGSSKTVQPAAPIPMVRHVASGIEKLVVAAEFPVFSPETLFDYFTQPELVQRWWPKEAEVTPKEGGEYHFRWPQQGWHLYGTYTTFARGLALRFTWRWEHEPDMPQREVHIRFESYGENGSKIELTHGAYQASVEDQKDRAGHWAGWKETLSTLWRLQAQQ